MCSIFGIAFLKGHTFKNKDLFKLILKNLTKEAESRGRTASGLAFTTFENIGILKKNVSGQRLVELPEFEEAFDTYVDFSRYAMPFSVMGHCRLKTKGTELDNKNNHPIIRDKIIGTHNGIISNDDILFDLFKDKIERNGDVDSEIIFALIDFMSKTFDINSSIKKSVKILKGSLACGMLHTGHPHSFWLFRTSNPCELVIYKKFGLIAWASDGNFISKAFSMCPEIGEGEKIEFAPYEGIGINLIEKNLNRFKL